jgi:hypothetical protein
VCVCVCVCVCAGKYLSVSLQVAGVLLVVWRVGSWIHDDTLLFTGASENERGREGVCVCVCMRERERERAVCAQERARERERASERERERVCVCVCERESCANAFVCEFGSWAIHDTLLFA